jgi:hypothetical protein
MKNADINLSSFKNVIPALVSKLRPYVSVMFLLLFATMYGIIILRINTLNNPAVNQSDVDAQVQSSPSLHIDANAAKQLQTLKDNSVNVQSLFDQGRTNPFQE